MAPQILSGIVVLVFLVFLAAGALFMVGAQRAVTRRRRDSAAPVARSTATVVGKRNEVVFERTQWYVTFGLPEGERREFQVAGAHSRELAVGERGMLEHQGSRLISFTRDRTIEAR